MNIINTDSTFPDCALINELKVKINGRKDTRFDFLRHLAALHERISHEVQFVSLLFPEYTPHNDEHHLSRLFHVADRLLGKQLIKNLNSAELFILACSLYGHDWGMAVSNDEREYILTGVVPADRSSNDFWTLPNEVGRLEVFARQYRLSLTDIKNGLLDDIYWREYVRLTHADRSGERIRRFFETIDRGIGEAVSSVCIGHWLDFQKLDDNRAYPSDFSVLNESANLLGLAIFVRLTDLFDIAYDRTPYVIWKFISPRDKVSSLEWKKHQALQPVTFPEYGAQNRYILVDGKTDDSDVYSALEDLRTYCEDQLRKSTDLLVRRRDPRHQLDLHHVEWRVIAQNFEPVQIRFEFDRISLFKILSDEIYQGDEYVFLRELLQNSIDAIRLRKSVLARRKMDSRELGEIRIKIDRGPNGDALITWTDDGIGMDEYIVRNYLSVAGVSYYGSDDFKREGLSFDPISRFGVGILSCFMVADHIEIQTYREPYFSPASDPLKINIPSMDKQFRIQKLNPSLIEVGTTVVVHVTGAKLANSEDKQEPYLDVIEYLSAVAGFVTYPIVIDDCEKKVVIVHPDTDEEYINNRYGSLYTMRKIDLDYPWENEILPQDLNSTSLTLKVKNYDLKLDLKIPNHEGRISFVVPKSEDIDFMTSTSNDVSAIKVAANRDYTEIAKIRVKESFYDWSLVFDGVNPHYETVGLSRSSQRYRNFALYRDGILLSEVQHPNVRSNNISDERLLPRTNIIINIPKSADNIIDLARTTLRGTSQHWYDPIRQGLKDVRVREVKEEFYSKDVRDKVLWLGKYLINNKLSFADAAELIDVNEWPVCLMSSGQSIRFVNWASIRDQAIRLPPPMILRYANVNLYNNFLKLPESYARCQHWSGEEVLLINDNRYAPLASAEKILNLSKDLVYRTHYLLSLEVVAPPYNHIYPLVQEVWEPFPNYETISLKELLKTALENIDNIHAFEYYIISQELKSLRIASHTFLNASNIGNLMLVCNLQIINVAHPAGRFLFQVCCWVALKRNEPNIDKKEIGKCEDLLGRLLPDPNNEMTDKRSEEYILKWQAEMKVNREKEYIGFPEAPSMIPTRTNLWRSYPYFSLINQDNKQNVDNGKILKSKSEIEIFLSAVR